MKLNRKIFLFLILTFHFTCSIKYYASGYITETKLEKSFPIVENNKGAKILLSSSDFTGVHKVASWLQNDINNLANLKPEIVFDKFGKDDQIIIIGTLNKNKFIDKLIENGKISLNELENKWEKFLIKTIENPFPNISKALVIVGSDKRGTIYGILDLAENIGVSPWYWWADVAFKKKQNIYVKDGTYTNGEPKVKYRGIFINDEAPALSGWAAEKFGTDKFNHKFYEHVFELILRLKGNFLWPAMWGRAFYEDDPENPKLADELGIVISTSHHEPMMRAHAEWQKYGTGPWNYEKNENELKEFWRDGIKRMGTNESVITLAMRGDGDEAMSDDANVSLLEKIVSDQRKIIEEVTKKDATEIPQVWALYKEVQEYYDKGMRVPDDVTILLCDDNWGNLRKLPKLNEKPRKGGYGIYYHFDYVGGPRNYKWLNTTQIERVWEQMDLAYNYGADKIWVVNVGDIKPMEFPISFFLDYAWNPEKITADNINCFYAKWAKEQFGLKHQLEIAEILKKYTKYNSRRKPELLSPETYSLTNYREFETVVNESKLIEKNAKEIYNDIPDENKDAFYQLVLHPVEACANLNNLYYTVAKNNMYAEQERILTNKLADEAKELFDRDKEITDYYHQLVDGKWNHMMDQTHIGYTYWQQPDSNSMPEVEYIDNDQEAEIGIMVEGSEKYYPDNSDTLMLPIFDKYNNQSYFIEIFNRGKNPFNYIIDENIDWINLSSVSGEIITEEKIFVSINWEKAQIGKISKTIIIKANGEQIPIIIKINNYNLEKNFNGFVESDGCISIEAEHYTKAISNDSITWQIIPNLGRTGSSVIPVPVSLSHNSTTDSDRHLEYEFYSITKGNVNINLYCSPTLNFANLSSGIKYAISIDDENPKIINLTNNQNPPDLNYDPIWNKWVAENINIQTSEHNLTKPGKHVLKIWAIDPGIVLQKIVIDSGGMKPSYLGPPDNYLIKYEN